MRLPLDRANHDALFALLDELERLQLPAVLIGGLVPPLLLETLDPAAAATAPDPRRTADCDLIVHLPVEAAGTAYERAIGYLAKGWIPDRLTNQFRWVHVSGLRLDLVPVPAGIESRDAAAVAMAARVSPNIDLAAFYRGQETAISTAIRVEVEDLAGGTRAVYIAGLVALLALKLGAWNDSYRDRRRDAHDVVWLLRYLAPQIVTVEIDAMRRHRPDLVARMLVELRADFADPWAAGISHYIREAFPDRYRNPDDDAPDDRHAAAAAIRRLLELCDAAG